MPTYTIYGKKGGGKTYYALIHYILPELVHGSRCVVTNVELKLPELSAYLARRYPEKNIDVNRRVRILSREETKCFWLHRQPGVDIPDVSKHDYLNGRNPDYGAFAHHGGVLYVIDEIHIDFDARAWANVGLGLTYYNSQERKLLDDQVFITQFLALVDKRVKDFSQEFILCRNWRYEKFMTIFTKGGGMEARHYAAPPMRDNSEVANEVHRYRIDPEKAECYDTTAGVGFRGIGKPDSQQKKRGVPMWAMFVAVPAVAFALSKGTDAISNKLSGNETVQRVTGKGVTPKREPVPVDVPRAAVTGAEQSRSEVRVAPVEAKRREVKPTGYAVGRGRVIVTMSDGSTRMGGFPGMTDDGIEAVERNGVVWQGEKHYLAGAVRSGRVLVSGVRPGQSASTSEAAAVPESVGPYVRDADGIMRIQAEAHKQLQFGPAVGTLPRVGGPPRSAGSE